MRGRWFAAAVLLALAFPARSAAHASFATSHPAPGSNVRVAPTQITMTFGEPLNRRVSAAELLDAHGVAIHARVAFPNPEALALVPGRRLPAGAYLVRWHSVAVDDGHALDGSFGFGVRSAGAAGVVDDGAPALVASTFARLLARWALYAGALCFAGALCLETLAPGWLTPAALAPASPDVLATVRRRSRLMVRGAGVLALGGAAVGALLDAHAAGRGWAPGALAAYLAHGSSGLGRLATVGALALALVLPARRVGWAAVAAAASLLAMAASGHAASAADSVLAVGLDAAHLLAAGLWLGGLAVVAGCWGPQARRLGAAGRRALAEHVAARFGIVAGAAFVMVVATGALSAVIDLGRVDALWQTGYGRVLAVKSELVGITGALAWWHAGRLRPRVIAGRTSGAGERRHWTLLRMEPWLAGAVLAAAAVLVVFPLPPRQLTGAVAQAPAACEPCPLAPPRAREVSMATHAGPYLVAAWLRRSRGVLGGTIRILDRRGRPAAAHLRVAGAVPVACGPGCWRVNRADTSVLQVTVATRRGWATARIPARWVSASAAPARRVLLAAESRMRRLASVRMEEAVTSGPGALARASYRFQAPDRQSYRTDLGETVTTIGEREWIAQPGLGLTEQPYGEGLPFRTREVFRWSPFARAITVRRRTAHGVDLALMDPTEPVWIDLHVRLADLRVTRVREISPGQFLTDRLHAFDRPLVIRPPGGIPRDR